MKKMDEDLEMIDMSETGTHPKVSHNKNTSAPRHQPSGKSAKAVSSPDASLEEEEDAEESASGKGGTLLQIIMISAIVIIIGIVAVMLIRWQKGIDLTITADDLTENYDIESEDFYAAFNPSSVEGYTDDGETNIVILADRTIYDYNDETGIPALIASRTGANVTTLALPDTKIALTNPGFTLENAEDAYNLYYLTLSICGGQHGSYDLQESALNYIEQPDIYRDYLDRLKQIDFSKVDILILCYGMNDYLVSSRSIGDEIYAEHPYGSMDSLSGSLDSSLKNLNERFPAMQIILSSPSYCLVKDADGNSIGADLYNTGNGSLGDYVAYIKGIAQAHQSSFADNYFFTDFNAGNHDGLLDDNGMPNETARSLIADHIISFFYYNRQNTTAN